MIRGEGDTYRQSFSEKLGLTDYQQDSQDNEKVKERGRGGGLGSRPKKMYGERLGDGVEYHLMSPTPRR